MKYFLMFLICGGWMVGWGQRIEEGMRAPEVRLRLENYKEPEVSLAALRPRVVILDFWNTHCLSCMMAFPRLDSLQRRFGDSIRVILVNSESREFTERFFSRHPKIRRPDLPMVTGDSVLVKHFTREGYPYSVWIDGAGVVRHITSGYNTTEAHIRSLMAGDSLNMVRARRKKQVSWLTTEPWARQVAFFSALSHYDGEYEVGNSVTEADSLVHLCHRGTLIDLVRIAWSGNEPARFLWNGRIDVKLKDPGAFVPPTDKNLMDGWLRRNAYNYELVVPSSRRAEVYALMCADLQRLTGMKVSWQKRTVMTYTLVRTGKGLSGSTGGAPSGRLYAAYHEYPRPGSMRVLKNRPFTDLTDVLRNEIERNGDRPFVDATGYAGTIDLAIPWAVIDQFSIEGWRSALKRYGLDLVQQEQTVEILVVSDE